METHEFVIVKDKLNEIVHSLELFRQHLNKLIDSQKRECQSKEINELATALAKAQAEIEIAGRKETNPFFKSKYADLAELIKVSRPALTKNGLAVLQQIITDGDGMTWIHTIMTHSTGQWIETKMRVIPLKNDPQSFGSCITYLRRYCYAALVNIAVSDEDDDGEAAMYDQRQVFAKGTALNTKYNPKENVNETITKEQREEMEYELESYTDIAEMILDGFKIRSIADMPKSKFMAAIQRVREIKNAREGK
jgi:hypothetical protein